MVYRYRDSNVIASMSNLLIWSHGTQMFTMLQ